MGINEKLNKALALLASVSLLTSFLFVGCDQQTEGCLDFRALIVTVDADNACTDCCVYPTLELQFIPVRFASDTVQRVFRSTDTLISGVDSGRFSSLGFYLHNITLIANDGERIVMQDTFTVFTGSDEPNFVYENSVLRVRPFRQTSYTLGILLAEKTFVALEASLGLPDVLSRADVLEQPSNSLLSTGPDTLLVSPSTGSLLDVAFKFETLAGVQDSFELSDGIDQLIRWELPGEFDYLPSYNARVTLGLPVDQLLSINNGTVNGAVFVDEFLTQGQVLEIVLSRS